MACTTKRSEQISGFASGQLTDGDADDLLEHIVVCSDCSEEFDTIADLVTCVERYGEELSRIKEESEAVRIFSRIAEIWRSVKNHWVGVPIPVRVLIPAAVAVVFVLLVFYPSGDDGVRYSQLAQFEAPPYIPRSLRGAETEDTVKMRFEEGMEAYAGGDFPTAVAALSEVTEAQPAFGEAYFYLGISYLMEDQVKSAIKIFRKAADLMAGYPLGEQSHWYLGMAFLKRGEGGKALREFQRVVDLNGAYRVNAERMIEKIENITE
ncbi:MAG: tetratricopeptide repeat protein [Gemmatimonadota bacterium]|nr:MAG: tetratricopeptide repeat protein [Gemmatimonadota bacterium]